MILFEKFGQHQPLNRQSERYRREGIDLSLSTLADQVGACTTALQPIYALIERHVLAAERLHGDDTTVPILARGKTVKGRIWTYVRDDRPFGGRAPPAALYYASRDRRHEHPVRHLPASPAYCRPTRTTATTSCTILRALRDRSSPHSVGLMRDGSSSSWQTSPRMLAREECVGDLANRAGSGQAHRHTVRHRARHQWPQRRATPAGAPGTECAASGRAGSLAA